ncbi:unnamed protein product (macronuclear) [Paramecium tetraurelia]|uniref:Uncharacterized protein n=1 Tax=Paramecium tetraurelia TaxID=5888 RepID=A0BUV3_PARTE|nr:uncharacterized protein GSPATT00005566001 [Paramecium tetraurelia]CAK62320.1 unnamed protein product [Paramecium tetraurelia]|eukprot:XP_001429718.1 hypothetical protein (macronuclear) [Paramecium tetraurelia strain d4-2]
MQSLQSDLKYIRDALTLLIDKLLPYIEQKQILQFCKTLKNKVADDKVTAFSIYMETQKSFEASQVKAIKLNSTSDEKFTLKVLTKIRQAQTEFKNNTQQFASIYNSVKENVESVYVSSQELQTMMNEKQTQNKVESRQEEIRRVSIYSKQNRQKTEQDISEEKAKKYKIEVKPEQNKEIKSDNNKFVQKVDQKSEIKQDKREKSDSKYSFEGSKKDISSAQDLLQNQRAIHQNQSQQQNKLEKPQAQLSPINYQQVKSQNISHQSSFNYLHTQPNSYTQVPLSKNSQTNNYTFVQQSSQSQKQILYSQSDQKSNSQMGSYVPNYDLLARVDQLLSKTKSNIQTQNTTHCLTNRI